jgi:hypothetical protein
VAKPELGSKRLCASCGAKFYDLNKTPIACSKCGTPFEVVPVTPVTTRSRPDKRAASREPEVEAEEVQGAELISLEEVDAGRGFCARPWRRYGASCLASAASANHCLSKSRRSALVRSSWPQMNSPLSRNFDIRLECRADRLRFENF